MARHQTQDERECPRRMVEYINNITPQLVDDFYTESNKIRYLRNAIHGKKWATTPLKNISTIQYNFDQLLMILNESMQLEREIEKASTSSKTFTASSSHILRTYANMILHIGVTQKNHAEYRSQQYNDPYRYNQGYQRDRSRWANRFYRYRSRSQNQFRNSSRNRFDCSRSLSRFRFGDRRPRRNNGYSRTNTSLLSMSCIGCGSSQYILADRRCTTSLEQIKKSLMNRRSPCISNRINGPNTQQQDCVQDNACTGENLIL